MENIRFVACNADNYQVGRGGSGIAYLVIHYTAGKGDTAAGNAAYFSRTAGLYASAHYFVDENEVVQSVREQDTAWHCGGDLQGSGGHAYFGLCTNQNSVGIELCSDFEDGQYVFTAATVQRAVSLVRTLMQRWGIDKSRVLRHYDVTGKICPAPFVRNEQAWQDFLTQIEEDEMTEQQVEQIVARALNARPRYDTVDDCPDWARPTVERLCTQGILQGDGEGRLGLDNDLLRMLVLCERMQPRYDTAADCPDWARPTVERLCAQGILQGDGEGKLGLSADLLRMLVLCERMQPQK